MTYSKSKQDEVETVIDDYASEWLDNYIIDEIKSVIEPAMKADGSSNITVADAIFDKINKYSGDLTQAVASSQLIPADIPYIIRNEVMNVLK